MKKLISLILINLFIISFAQIKPYQFYNKKGKEISPEQVARQLTDYDVVLFGEHHNNSINHWLQLKITQDLYKLKSGKIILGAEMFERDDQAQLNQYLNGKIDPKNLKDSVRLWSNYNTDYRPLLDFAKDKRLPFVATNIPRKYASQVAKQGLESLNFLTKEELKNIANLPIKVTLDTPGYKDMKSMMGDHADINRTMNFISAQAIKDATIAESILKNYKKNQLFIHYNGDYHSKQYGGIYWYLKEKNPELKIAIISIFESDDDQLSLPRENYIPTEFNLLIPSDMTKTY